MTVFPELFTTGYNIGKSVNALSEVLDGHTVTQLTEIAKKYNVAIITGFLEKDGDELCNSAIAISETGEIIAHHRKVSLFGDIKKYFLYRKAI